MVENITQREVDLFKDFSEYKGDEQNISLEELKKSYEKRTRDDHESVLQIGNMVSYTTDISTGNMESHVCGQGRDPNVKVLTFVNVKQYKRILQRRQAKIARRLRWLGHTKVITILPRIVNFNQTSVIHKVHQEQVSTRMEIRMDQEDQAKRARQQEHQPKCINGTEQQKAKIAEELEDDSKMDQYSPNSTPLTWSSNLYIEELMGLKRRLEGLETLERLKYNKWQETMDTNHKIMQENGSLKEEIVKLQTSLKTRQQEIMAVKEELKQV
ncbi:hypothetical protein SUGI_0578130 [Cryptomeria japonica]|nr:hypothetical protein SUGI_0578130 [Cryptomeria japonica]